MMLELGLVLMLISALMFLGEDRVFVKCGCSCKEEKKDDTKGG